MPRRVSLLTVTCLATLLCLAPSAFAVPDIPSSAFESAQGCGCHAGFQVTWADSMHGKALTDPIYQYELGLAIRATDGALGPFCNGCHTPVAVMAGEISGTLPADDITSAGLEGVTCDFCHQVTGTHGERVGNSSYALDDPDGTKRAQFDDAKSPYHETAYSAFHESAEFCGNCHDVYHPVNGLPLEATYTEWKNGPFAAEGIVCQDCHMTPGPGVTKPNPGKAAPFGVDRDHIYLMTFAGGNVALGDADLAEERLKAAATVEIETPGHIEPGTKGEIEVTVSNVGAGHYIPTGLTEFRQMWLEVVSINADGVSATIGEHRYGTELADAEGNYPVPLWEAVSIGWDDRIPPQESRSYTYEVNMPADGVANIEATLYYRSVSEEVAEHADVDVPTTTMAQTSQVIYGSAEIAADAARATMGDREPQGGFNVLVVAVLALIGAVIVVLAFARKVRDKDA